MSLASEESEFKFVLSAILASLGKVCTERDLRQTYQNEEGENVDRMIQKLGAGSLVSFLRNKCQTICRIIQDGNYVKIMRLSNQSSQHMDYMTKSQNRKKNRAKRMVMQNRPSNSFGPPQHVNFIRFNYQNQQKTNFNHMQTYRQANPLKEIQPVHSVDQRDPAAVDQSIRNAHSVSSVAIEQYYDGDEDSDSGSSVFSVSLVSDPAGTEAGEDPEALEDPQSLDDLEPVNIAVNDTEFITDDRSFIPNPKLCNFSSMVTFKVKLIGHCPWDFWMRYNEQSYELLQKKLTEFYSRDVKKQTNIKMEAVKVGTVVAVETEEEDGRLYHRAEVREECNSSGFALLFFLDLGVSGVCHVSSIHFLHKSLALEPVRALRAELAGVEPIEADWSEKAKKVFVDLVADKTLKAAIREQDRENDNYKVEIFIDSTNLSDLLVREGLAKRTPIESKVFSIPAFI